MIYVWPFTQQPRIKLSWKICLKRGKTWLSIPSPFPSAKEVLEIFTSWKTKTTSLLTKGSITGFMAFTMVMENMGEWWLKNLPRRFQKNSPIIWKDLQEARIRFHLRIALKDLSVILMNIFVAPSPKNLSIVEQRFYLFWFVMMKLCVLMWEVLGLFLLDSTLAKTSYLFLCQQTITLIDLMKKIGLFVLGRCWNNRGIKMGVG